MKGRKLWRFAFTGRKRGFLQESRTIMTLHIRRLGTAGFVAIALSSCAPSEPTLKLPQPIDSYCGWRVALGSSINSIVSSIDNRSAGAPSPAFAAIRRSAKAQTGAVAHWPGGQLLYAPAEAHAAGITGDYVTMRAAAVVGLGGTGTTRPVEVEVNEGGRWRWITFQAYDKQDVCDTGTRSL